MLNIYIFIAIVFYGTSILVAVYSVFLDAKHLPVMWSNPCREAEQRRRQPVMFFLFTWPTFRHDVKLGGAASWLFQTLR